MSEYHKSHSSHKNFGENKPAWNKGMKMPQFSKENHPNWNGGKFKANGYIKVLCPEHPRQHLKYVFEHIIVAEEKLGRYLLKNEDVHHINGIRDDNRPENIIVMTHSEHLRYHAKIRNNKFGKNKQ